MYIKLNYIFQSCLFSGGFVFTTEFSSKAGHLSLQGHTGWTGLNRRDCFVASLLAMTYILIRFVYTDIEP